MEYAKPETAAQVRQLAENLEQFDYAPGVQNVEEYGRYMIQESGRFEYDENLHDFYDYARYGLERMNAEEGRVVKSGYVSYNGVLTLEELMSCPCGEPATRRISPASWPLRRRSDSTTTAPIWTRNV